MSANLRDLAPELRDAARDLVDAAGSAGLLPRVTSTVRSRAEQARLYRRSKQGLQKYPVAPPGFSAHEYGWAFDLVVTPFEAIYDVGYTWKQWGGAWSPKDDVHFELPGAAEEAKRLGAQSTGASWWDVFATSLNFTNLPSALIELLWTAASEEEAYSIIQQWNKLTGSHIDPYGKAF